MTIYDQIEEDQTKLIEMDEAAPEEVEEEEPTLEEEIQQAEEPEEAVVEEETKEEPVEDESKPEPKDFVRMRREKRELAAAKKQLEQERAELAALRSKMASGEEKEEAKEESEDDRVARLEEVVYKQDTERQHADLIRSAANEFVAIEKDFKQDVPDYMDVINNARAEYEKAMGVMNPSASKQDIKKAVDMKILNQASVWAQKGLNPAEEFYDFAKEKFGEPKAAKSTKNKKASMDVISKNKKRSATSLQGGSSGKPPLSAETAANDMSLAEFSKLTAKQLHDLEEESFEG